MLQVDGRPDNLGGRHISPTIWASAHTTQFTRPGMHYLLQGYGSGPLQGGGTYVTFHDSEHLTIVIETASAAVGSFCDANCNGVCQLGPATGTQQATFELQKLKFQLPKTLAVWRTKLGNNISDETSFQALPPVVVSSTGKVSLTLEQDTIYTLSTVLTATKAGSLMPEIPASAPFPLPYSDDFDASALSAPGRYWSDMDGGFEIAMSASDPHNKVLKQTATKKACCNFIQSLDGPMPLSILGSSAWENIQASISIALPTPQQSSTAAGIEEWGVFGLRGKFRAASFFQGGLGTPSGVFVAVCRKGWVLIDGIGAKQPWLPCKPPSCLDSGSFPSSDAVWHRVKVRATQLNSTQLLTRLLSVCVDLNQLTDSGACCVSWLCRTVHLRTRLITVPSSTYLWQMESRLVVVLQSSPAVTAS